MERDEMLRLFEAHRKAEAARDFDAILATAFPDLSPDDRDVAFGDDVLVAWAFLRGTSGGEWLGIPPGGGSFAVPFANVAPFRDGLMAGESIYLDLATLCEQGGLPLAEIRAAAKARATD